MGSFVTDETWRRRQHARAWALATLLSGQMMASLQTSMVSVAAPSIRHDLHATAAGIQLVVAGYVLPYAALLVTGARLGSDVGPRRLFILGAAGLTTFSVASGLAPGVWVLVAAQVGAGASAALMVPQVLALIHSLFRGQDRARAVGLYSMVLAVAVALGQVLGGVLVSADVSGLAWRPIFLIDAPLGLALLLLARVGLPSVRQGIWSVRQGSGKARPDSLKDGSRGLDVSGVVVLALALILLVAPLTVGPDLGWPRLAWASLAAAPVVLAYFVVIELAAARHGRQPLFDIAALRAPGVGPGLMVVLATMASFGGLLFTISQYLQVGLAWTPLAAGLTFTPYAGGFAVVSLRWSRLPAAIHRWLPSAGLAAMGAAGLTLAMGLRSGWSPALLAVLLVAGAGHAAAFSPLVAQVAHRLGPERADALGALVPTTTQVAVVIGVAVLGSLYLSIVRAGGAASSGRALALVCAAIACISLLGTAASLRVAARS